jgi:hypothetical protein
LVTGLGLGLADFDRARLPRSWSVVFAAVALVLCGIALVYLYYRTGGSYRCEPR